MKLSLLMDNLKRKRYAPPARSEGWFTLADAISEGQLSEKLASEILREESKAGNLENRTFQVWDDAYSRVVTRTYYRQRHTASGSGLGVHKRPKVK